MRYLIQLLPPKVPQEATRGVATSLFNEVTGFLSVCTEGSRRTDMILLYNVDSHRFWEGLKLFWGRVPTPSQEKSQKICLC